MTCLQCYIWYEILKNKNLPKSFFTQVTDSVLVHTPEAVCAHFPLSEGANVSVNSCFAYMCTATGDQFRSDLSFQLPVTWTHCREYRCMDVSWQLSTVRFHKSWIKWLPVTKIKNRELIDLVLVNTEKRPDKGKHTKNQIMLNKFKWTIGMTLSNAHGRMPHWQETLKTRESRHLTQSYNVDSAPMIVGNKWTEQWFRFRFRLLPLCSWKSHELLCSQHLWWWV